MLDSFKKWFRHFWQGQLVSEALLTVDSDKIRFLVRINPQWNLMREMFSRAVFHVAMVSTERSGGNGERYQHRSFRPLLRRRSGRSATTATWVGGVRAARPLLPGWWRSSRGEDFFQVELVALRPGAGGVVAARQPLPTTSGMSRQAGMHRREMAPRIQARGGGT